MIIFTYNPQIRNYAPNMIQKRKEPVGTGAEQDDTAGSGHAGHQAEQLRAAETLGMGTNTSQTLQDWIERSAYRPDTTV